MPSLRTNIVLATLVLLFIGSAFMGSGLLINSRATSSIGFDTSTGSIGRSSSQALTVSLSASNEIVFLGIVNSSNVNAPPGFTQIGWTDNFGNGKSLMVYYQVVANSGSFSVTISNSDGKKHLLSTQLASFNNENSTRPLGGFSIASGSNSMPTVSAFALPGSVIWSFTGAGGTSQIAGCGYQGLNTPCYTLDRSQSVFDPAGAISSADEYVTVGYLYHCEPTIFFQ